MANVDKMLSFLSKGIDAKNTASKAVNDIKGIGKDTSSIKQRAKGLILQYPVLMSDVVSVEAASAVLRSLEHEYANLMTLIISDQSTAVGEITTTGYLAQFHNNINESASISTEDIKLANNEIMSEIDVNLFNEDSLNDFTVDLEVLNTFNEAVNDAKFEQERQKFEQEKNDFKNKQAKDDLKREQDKLEKLLQDNKGKNERNTRVGASIENNEVKKLNDVAPTIIKGVINNSIDGQVVAKNIHFGIKCVMHSVDSSELITNLSMKVSNPALIMKFIEWTTGEKKLLTDIIMEKNTMKSLAKTKSATNYWFRRLEKISNSAENNKAFKEFVAKVPFGRKLANALNLGNKIPMPITSLVISKSEVDQIKLSAGVDLLKNAKMVKEIMRRYYLLSFVIVDDVTGTVYFFNEVSNRYAQYSLKQVQGFGKDNLMTPEEALKKSLMR